MKHISKAVFFIIIFVITTSCSTKKDTVISRNFHAMTTKFNVLFNGKEAFNKGIVDLNAKFKDNYWKQLPVEPLQFEEVKIEVKFGAPGLGFGDEKENKKQLTRFDKAEEKAVKAIQMHSMNINGVERNRQIDDAYLLLGKSRYYSQRFIPAIEAFNYIITNYPYASLIGETKIWRAKANLRIDNEKLAIESLKLLLEIRKGQESFLSEKVKEEAHTALAMAYIQTDSIEKAKKQLTYATETFYNREQSARNLFILGQIYGKQQQKDSAVMVFKRLADFKKAPYKYRIHAEIELAKNNIKDATTTALIARFYKLIKNRDNRKYVDELYYQVAVLEENNDSIATAIINYNKSLRAKGGSDKQKTFTYEKLGNLYFKQEKYIVASAYYDSVLKVAKEKSLRIRRVKRKHKHLASLIKFENILAINDSVLRIASMSKDAQKTYFEVYIKKLKKEDEERAQQQLNKIAFGNSFGGNSLQSVNKGKWYFYNTQSVGFGTSEFQKVWGDKVLEDNWRWSDKSAIKTIEIDSVQSKKIVQKYELSTYLEAIPSTKKAINSLKIERNNALYELGIIYKEQFKNLPLASKRLERALLLNIDKKVVLPINYHLYQIYTVLGNTSKAKQHKNIILTEYPDTKFAQVIQFPNKEIKEEKKVTEIEKKYKEIYYFYKENKFKEVVEKIEKILPNIQKSKLIPKFELLKAYAIGKYKEKKEYIKAMEFVAQSYVNTKEGKKAKAIVKQLN